jgi:hypothetical protein
MDKPAIIVCGAPTNAEEVDVEAAFSAPSEPCPKCGGEVANGYGLAGGGIGTYAYCTADGCDYFIKAQDRE